MRFVATLGRGAAACLLLSGGAWMLLNPSAGEGRAVPPSVASNLRGGSCSWFRSAECSGSDSSCPGAQGGTGYYQSATGSTQGTAGTAARFTCVHGTIATCSNVGGVSLSNCK